MTLLPILSPQARGVLLNWRAHPVSRRLVAAWSRQSGPDPIEAHIAQAIRRHQALRRAV